MKKETKKVEETPKAPTKAPMRQIIIETDGNNINLTKADVSGRIELIGVLQSVLGQLNQPPK